MDFEAFLAFLDIEHRLGFAGSDTWSDEGNPTQIVVKQLIARILNERTPARDQLPEEYYAFVDQLTPGDIILSFNYDVLLERAFEHVGKPFRLFDDRYSEVRESHAVSTDDEEEEVVLLKMHGSIDWFDRSTYDERCAVRGESGLSSPASDPVFGPAAATTLAPLTEGPRFADDSLQNVYRVVDGLDSVYSHRNFIGGTPLLLNPSKAKALYADRLRYHWWGIGRAGGMNLGIAIIGYSLPEHDDYAGQALFRVLRNYQDSWWEDEHLNGRRKEKIIFVDLREEGAGRDALRRRYGFLDERKTTFKWTGFDHDAVALLREGCRPV